MADYYTLIARAVAGLQDRSPAMRKAVYQRARQALVGQLRSLDPPLAQANLERERRSLEAAIVRVEAEQAAVPAAPALPDPPAPPPSAALTAPRPRIGEPPPPPPISRRQPPAKAKAAAGRPVRARAAAPAPRREAPPRQPEARVPPPPPPDDLDSPAEPAVRPRIAPRQPLAVSRTRQRSLLLGAIVGLAVVLIAVAAWVLRDRPSDLARMGNPAEAPLPRSESAKVDERIGSGAASSLAAPAGAPPAARPEAGAGIAVLYEEDPANPQIPRSTTGRVTWRLEAVNAGQGQPLDSAIRAEINMPEAGFALSLLLRRNLDASLPASHTIELAFTTRAGQNGRVVRDVGLLQLKNDVAARGTPLAGLPVPVRDNLFLIGLSSLPNDVERNIDLLRTRNWIDLPIRNASGMRAIVSFEKGPAGSQTILDAFQQWRAPAKAP